jgi:ketosteroid isomerase-like protein
MLAKRISMALLCLATAGPGIAGVAEDKQAVADLDTRYQRAVKENDAQTMAAILHDDFVLVTGKGTVYTKGDLLKSARDKEIVWEQQDEEAGSQTVRVWGDTAVVTAKLWLKYTAEGQQVDKKLWFSDTYIRTPQGWRYAFGQSSLALPATP